MDDILKDFLAETSDQLDSVGAQLVQFEQDPGDARIIASIFRLVHTIKGTCGFLGLPRLANIAHSAETLLGKLRDGATATHERVSLILAAIDRIRLILAELEKSSIEPDGSDGDLINAIEQEVGDRGANEEFSSEIDPMSVAMPAEVKDFVAEPAPRAETTAVAPPPPVAPTKALAPTPPAGPATIRVAVGALERIMALVSELVLTRNQLLEITRHSNDEALKNPLQHLSSLTTDLQDGVMRARMQPIGRLFSNLPRLVRELAAELDKKISLIAEGSDTELDRQLIELIRDPLTHMVRNCADHGVETPDVRRAAGKPEIGTIRVRASHETGHITIEISDDGRGLDVERIRAKAIALGLATADEISRMTNDAVCRFIFAAGFSTATHVTSISGRGVGMDVVRENIESIGGTIALSTTVGRGTSFSLKIPLTLAIAPALIIESRGHRFALPQHAVVEAVGVSDSGARIDNVQGALVLRLRDQVLPIADLGHFLGLEETPVPEGVDQLVVVMRVGSLNFGIIVDGVCDVQEIVVKPLGLSLTGLTTFSGNTILGDGSVVLILDPPGLAKTLGLDNANEFRVAPSQPPFVLPNEPMRLIVFRAGPGALKAAPLSIISRIESVRSEDIFTSDGMRVMTHQGRLMPLISPRDDVIATMPGGVQPVLVIGVGGEPMGLLVSEIVDIIEENLEIEIAGESPSVIGSTTIRGEPAEILDITHFMRIARPGAFSRGHTRRFAVLIVDDKLFFRDMLSPIVSAAGYEVSTAGSAAEALELFDKGAQFDAVVTDTDMPDMDGYSFARALLADGRRDEMPIIAMAAHAAPAVLAAAKTAGMRTAVGKFDRGSLLAALNEALDGNAFNFHALESRVIAKDAA
jgi:two-component system chemotaxis sensor kinase CheA